MKKVCMVFALLLAVGLLCTGCGASRASTPENEYENYYILNGDFQIVVSDPEQVTQGDTMLRVSLVRNSGPHTCTIRVLSQRVGETDWRSCGETSLEVGTACSFSIPGNSIFQVVAQGTEGKNGYATFRVEMEA